MAVTNHI